MPGIEIDRKRIITSDEAIGLREVPKTMVIMGSGAVGVEFASIFNRFGSDVTIAELLPRLVPVEDEAVSVGELHLDVDAVGARLRAVTFAPVWLVMPCLRNDFSSSADTASSSTGTSRGSSSTIVTSLPNRRKIDANSTPTAPLPMIAMRLRHLAQVNRFVARDDALAIDLDAGHARAASIRWRR